MFSVMLIIYTRIAEHFISIYRKNREMNSIESHTHISTLNEIENRNIRNILWRNCSRRIGWTYGYFQRRRHDTTWHDTIRRRPHPIDIPSREPCRENESHVDANVIIVGEKSRWLAAVVQSNHAIVFCSQDFHPSLWRTFYESTWISYLYVLLLLSFFFFFS